MASHRGHFRHVRRRDERGGAGPRPSDGRASRARGRRWRRSGGGSPTSARFSPFQRGPMDILLGRWTLDSSPMYVAMDLMSRLVSPYDVNPRAGQSASRDSRRTDRFRRARAVADQPLHHRHQRAHGPRQGVQERGHHARRPARLGLPADHVPGDRDRRRGLLGRRLFRQSDALDAHPRKQVARHDPDPDQPDRAVPAPAHGERNPQSAERGFLQRRRSEGAEDDGAACARSPIPATARDGSGRRCASISCATTF